MAALHRGAIAVPLDPNHPDGVLRSILADCDGGAECASGAERARARIERVGVRNVGSWV